MSASTECEQWIFCVLCALWYERRMSPMVACLAKWPIVESWREMWKCTSKLVKKMCALLCVFWTCFGLMCAVKVTKSKRKHFFRLPSDNWQRVTNLFRSSFIRFGLSQRTSDGNCRSCRCFSSCFDCLCLHWCHATTVQLDVIVVCWRRFNNVNDFRHVARIDFISTMTKYENFRLCRRETRTRGKEIALNFGSWHSMFSVITRTRCRRTNFNKTKIIKHFLGQFKLVTPEQNK